MSDNKGKSAEITNIDELLESKTKEVAPINVKLNTRRTNIPLLIMMFVIVVFGLVALYSISGPAGYAKFDDSAYYLKRQLFFTVIGLVGALILNFVEVKFLAKKPIVVLAYVVALLFALGTLVLGYSFNGARRWIQIGSTQFQASEGVKVALIVAYAGYRKLLLEAREKGKILPRGSKRSQRLFDAFLDFILPITLAIVVDVLIVVEPHFSCFIIIAIVIFIMTTMAGVHIRSWIYGAGVFAVLAALLAAGIFMIPSTREKATSYIESNFAHVFKRFDMFDDSEDQEDSKITEDDTRQIDNAHNALGSGGMWGVGLGESRSKYNYIAEAQNDYIFSVYVEETGFVGGTILILLYMVIFAMCMMVVWRADSVHSRMLAGGATALIFVEAVLNLSVELQVIPSTGITLPFMSYGGTAQIFLLWAFGLILCVSRSGTSIPVKPEKTKKDKNYGV